MLNRPLLYYITDRKAFGSDESTRRQRLLEKITEAARSRVDYIQLREKDLSIRDLESLAREAIKIIRENSSPREQSHQLRPDHPPPALLINSRADVALATGADGDTRADMEAVGYEQWRWKLRPEIAAALKD